MPGNSQRRGAMRKPTTRKGPQVGCGGQRRKGLEGRGPTPKAVERTKHPAAKNAARTAKRDARVRCRPQERAGPSGRTRAQEGARLQRDRRRAQLRRRGAARRGAGHHDVRRRPDRLRRPGPRGAEDRDRALDPDPGDAARRARPAHRRRRAPGARPAGAAVRLRPPERPGQPRDPRHPAHRRAGRHHRPAQPRRDHPLGRGLRWSRGRRARAPVGRYDRQRLEDVRRCRGPDPGGPGQQPDPRAGGVPQGRASSSSAWTWTATCSCPTSSWPASRWWSSSGPRARDCPGWCGETCDQIVSIPMSSAVESLNAGIATGVTLYEVARRRAL